MNKQTGFTIIEVMITMAILAVLAAIAVPSYTNYMIRGRIPDATSNLAVKRVQIEQFFLDNRSYLDTASNPAPACASDTGRSKYFDFNCSSATATGYVLQAVGKGPMNGFTFTIDQANNRQTTQVPAGWTTNATCWVVRKNGDCI